MGRIGRGEDGMRGRGEEEGKMGRREEERRDWDEMDKKRRKIRRREEYSIRYNNSNV